MRKQVLIAFAGVAALLAAGCQTWQPGGTPVSLAKGAVAITPPAGWKHATIGGADLIASKEGPVLQKMVVEHVDLSQPPPKETKRAVAAGMTPFEVAEAVIGELRANQELLGLDVRENTPVDVGGKPGIKIVFAFRTKDGLQLTEARYSALVGQTLWHIRYVAPTRHYFERDLAAFEAAVRTTRIPAG